MKCKFFLLPTPQKIRFAKFSKGKRVAKSYLHLWLGGQDALQKVQAVVGVAKDGGVLVEPEDGGLYRVLDGLDLGEAAGETQVCGHFVPFDFVQRAAGRRHHSLTEISKLSVKAKNEKSVKPRLILNIFYQVVN
jgi:hypothetical protein